jgi:hypothetical protein
MQTLWLSPNENQLHRFPPWVRLQPRTDWSKIDWNKIYGGAGTPGNPLGAGIDCCEEKWWYITYTYIYNMYIYIGYVYIYFLII